MKRYRMLLAPLLGLALALPLSALADAPESTAQIQTDLRDGQAPGSITPQVMRNFAVSVFDPFPAVVSAAGTTQGTATVLMSQFNTNGTNNPISVPAGGAAEFIMQTTTQGYWH